MKVNDLTSKTFARITITHRVPSKRPGVARWAYRCVCGTEGEANGIEVSAGRVKSCGCIRRDDIAGQRFGRLIAVEPTGQMRRGRSLWRCLCDCGNEHVADIALLRNRHTQSCGCLHAETAGSRLRRHGQASSGKKTALYQTWAGIHRRCNDARDPDYGGRGVSVCDRWSGESGFVNFAADMGERPSPRHSIDRIDPNRGYGPGNCRWATKTQQSRNRRDTILLTRGGVTLPLAEWAERLGLKYRTVHRRLRHGCSHEEALVPLKPA